MSSHKVLEDNINISTFIKALESFPVHCLNPRPCGNRLSPGKGGTAAMLPQNQSNYTKVSILTYWRSISAMTASKLFL